MSRATNQLENDTLNALFGRAAFPSISHLYLGLWSSGATAAALEAGSLISEISGGNYARVTLHSTQVMSAASGGAIPNATEIIFPIASAAWNTIAWVGLMNTGGTNGTMYLYSSLSSPVNIGSGEQFRIAASNLVFTCD